MIITTPKCKLNILYELYKYTVSVISLLIKYNSVLYINESEKTHI